MELSRFRRELVRLTNKVREEATDPRNPYTKGYLDALIYVIEWIDEIED